MVFELLTQSLCYLYFEVLYLQVGLSLNPKQVKKIKRTILSYPKRKIGSWYFACDHKITHEHILPGKLQTVYNRNMEIRIQNFNFIQPILTEK